MTHENDLSAVPDSGYGIIDSTHPITEQYRLLIEGVKDYAIFLLDQNGIISTWNLGAERIKGYRASEIIGKHFSIFYPPEKIAEGWPEHELIMARREGRFEDEGWRLRKDGTRFWANVIITPLTDRDGKFLGFSKITRDLTEQRRANDELRQSEERFRLLVEGVKDYAIFMLDPNGIISTWNLGAERIKGYRADEIIGKHFSTFYPHDKIAEGWPEYELTVARREGRFEDEGWRVRKDGTLFWANVIITAIFDEPGRLQGFAKITRDLTQRKRVEALEESERRMTEFMAMLSHELRNPLAPIRNALGFIQMMEIDDQDVKWATDVIDRQVSHLTRLVDDLLEVSRVTTGTIKLRKESVDMNDVVRRALEASQPLIESRHHTLELHLSNESLPMEADTTRMTQVVLNVLNNAAKYTPEGGHIIVTTGRQGTCATVRVDDNGIGIAPEFRKRMFEMFAQGERSLDRSEGGLGIGLTLVRRLVEMHGGTVEAYSDGPGRGSQFKVKIPMSEAQDHEGSAASTLRSGRDGALRILVVDDNVDIAESMQRLLSRIGYVVRSAPDGPTALEAVPELMPDVMLLDIGLPGLSGYDVARAVRALPEGKNVELVAMTGYGQEEDRRHALEAGFTHHLVKPVDMTVLRSLLTTLARERSQRITGRE